MCCSGHINRHTYGQAEFGENHFFESGVSKMITLGFRRRVGLYGFFGPLQYISCIREKVNIKLAPGKNVRVVKYVVVWNDLVDCGKNKTKGSNNKTHIYYKVLYCIYKDQL